MSRDKILYGSWSILAAFNPGVFTSARILIAEEAPEAKLGEFTNGLIKAVNGNSKHKRLSSHLSIEFVREFSCAFVWQKL